MKHKYAIPIITVLFVLAALLGLYNLMNSRDYQSFGKITSRVETRQKVVALTFDDGPTENTEEILAILDKNCKKATFFVCGIDIEKNPALASRIVEAGHEIGNHSYSHRRMVFMTYSDVAKEIEATDKMIRKAGWVDAIHFRPPYGKKLFVLPFYLAENGRRTIMWSIEPDSYSDIASDPNKIIDYTCNQIQPGSIILLHAMNNRPSREAIGGIVKALQSQGYRFVTVSELLAIQDTESTEK